MIAWQLEERGRQRAAEAGCREEIDLRTLTAAELAQHLALLEA